MSSTSSVLLDRGVEPSLFDLDAYAERYRRREGLVQRCIDVGGHQVETALVDRAAPELAGHDAFDQSWLRSHERPSRGGSLGRLRAGDLFCGVGGLSIGLESAAWGLGLGVDHTLAADLDRPLLDRFVANFAPRTVVEKPLELEVDGGLGEAETAAERDLVDRVGELDVVLAGPPCQGHSDLNNHTRRDDPRNALYERTVRVAEIFSPRHVLVENVPGVVHDRTGVVERARTHLASLGYTVDAGLVRAEEIGVAQRRRRFFLLASRTHTPSIAAAIDGASREVRPVTWAIGDLGGEGNGPFDSSARHSEENRRRIGHLLAHGLYDLPDSERPPCHRDKSHSYRSVYGRMRPDEPAPTITVGFGSTGQGRFIHPFEARTLTPHEAARVQSFPDWFDFDGLKRTQLQKAIGNAVPPTMAAAVLRELLLGELL